MHETDQINFWDEAANKLSTWEKGAWEGHKDPLWSEVATKMGEHWHVLYSAYANLEVAIALVNRRLPGWRYRLNDISPSPFDGTYRFQAMLDPPSGSSEIGVGCEAREPRCAIFGAMFRALQHNPAYITQNRVT